MRRLLHILGFHYSVPFYVGGSGRMIGYFCQQCGAPVLSAGAFRFTRKCNPSALYYLKPGESQFSIDR